MGRASAATDFHSLSPAALQSTHGNEIDGSTLERTSIR